MAITTFAIRFIGNYCAGDEWFFRSAGRCFGEGGPITNDKRLAISRRNKKLIDVSDAKNLALHIRHVCSDKLFEFSFIGGRFTSRAIELHELISELLQLFVIGRPVCGRLLATAAAKGLDSNK